jgi:hypothetical protein
MDADTWVQERFGLDAFCAEAAKGALAVLAHNHPVYRRSAQTSHRR